MQEQVETESAKVHKDAPTRQAAHSSLRGKKLFRRAWWWVHTKLPNNIPSPYEWNTFHLATRDDRDNNATEVPLDEALRLQCVWAAELFGPSEIEGLYANLRKLGWHEDRMERSGRGAVEWIMGQRLYGSEGNFNFGIVNRHGDNSLLHCNYFAKIPDEIDYLIAEVHQISPSLTCVLVIFVLKEALTQCYEEALNVVHTTKREPIKARVGAYRIIGPDYHKRREIDNIRLKYRKLAKEWFSSKASFQNKLPHDEYLR